MEKKRSVGVRRIILITLLGLLVSLFATPYSFQMAISQEQEQSDKQALKKWEQYSGMTAEEYWQGWYKFLKEKKEIEAKVNELVKKYFGGKYQSFDDLMRQSVALPQEFLEEFESLNYQVVFPPDKLSCPPPPVEPPEWFKKEVLSEPVSKQQFETRAKTDVQCNIATALKLYELDNGMFPTTEQGLFALLEKPTIAPIPKNWHGPYLEVMTKDPWGKFYNYICPGLRNKDSYDLSSYGPDGVESEDDITNWNSPTPK